MKPFNLTFLSGNVPMTKRFEMVDGQLTKHSYPNIKNLTSSITKIASINDLYQAILKNSEAKDKPCILKGLLSTPLVNESRRNMSPPDTLTQWVCLDFDNAPYATAAEAMKAIGLDDISYVWQFSASAKLNPKNKKLSGHAFILLDSAVQPKVVRAWTMYLNLRTDSLKKAITLNAAKTTLHYPLDICVNDNSRIIFIASPVFGKGVNDPLPKGRVTLVKKPLDALPKERLAQHAIEALKKEQNTYRDDLRKKEGLDGLKSKVKMVGEFEVQPGIGEATSYEVIDDGGEFIRYNLNGGDSQAYWHPRGNYELLHSFKGEPSVYIKEIMPQRYAELVGNSKDQIRTPNASGDLLLAFREKRTAEYWKGTWNPGTMILDIHPVRSKDQLEDYMAGHGTTVGPYVPEWQMVFDPQNDVVVNEVDHICNTFVLPPLLREGGSKKGLFPNIQRAINSAVGVGEIQDHFINWLAVIFQFRIKTHTAWILHGTYGTGKGVIINEILRPILGKLYCDQITASTLQQNFDGWKENKLIMMIDEIDADIFDKAKAATIESNMMSMITEPFDVIHRKNVNQYSVPSHLNLIFGSNKTQPVKIRPGDRRFNVGVYQPKRWKPSAQEIKDIAKELPAFAHHLMNYKADIDRARTALLTEDKEAIQALSITSVEEFSRDLLEGNLVKLFEYMPDERVMSEHNIVNTAASVYSSCMKRFAQEPESKITRDQLKYLFEHAIGRIPAAEGANKFTSFLRHNGIITRRLWIDGQAEYGICITWVVSAEDRKEILKTNKPIVPKLRTVR